MLGARHFQQPHVAGQLLIGGNIHLPAQRFSLGGALRSHGRHHAADAAQRPVLPVTVNLLHHPFHELANKAVHLHLPVLLQELRAIRYKKLPPALIQFRGLLPGFGKFRLFLKLLHLPFPHGAQRLVLFHIPPEMLHHASRHNLRPLLHGNRAQRAGKRLVRSHLPAIAIQQGKHIQPNLVGFQPEPVRIGQKPLYRGNQLLRLRQQLKAALPVSGLIQVQLIHRPLRSGPHLEHHLVIEPVPIGGKNPVGHPAKPSGPERNAAKLGDIPGQRNGKHRGFQQAEPVQAAHDHAFAVPVEAASQTGFLFPVGKDVHKWRLQGSLFQLPLHPFQAGKGLLRPIVIPAL